MLSVVRKATTEQTDPQRPEHGIVRSCDRAPDRAAGGRGPGPFCEAGTGGRWAAKAVLHRWEPLELDPVSRSHVCRGFATPEQLEDQRPTAWLQERGRAESCATWRRNFPVVRIWQKIPHRSFPDPPAMRVPSASMLLGVRNVRAPEPAGQVTCFGVGPGRFRVTARVGTARCFAAAPSARGVSRIHRSGINMIAGAFCRPSYPFFRGINSWCGCLEQNHPFGFSW